MTTNPKIKVLLAEDEPSLGMIVKESLETRGFIVQWFENGQAAFNSFSESKPDILVLDVMMPLKDGFSLAREIRKKDQQTPIIFLTAKSQTEDLLEGYDAGGNDYLKKPFSMEELIVRMKELLQRKEKLAKTSKIQIGEYSFDYPKQRLKHDELELQLTHREAEVLKRLAEARNVLVDRSVMLSEIWGDDDFFNARSMDVFITKLRKKLSKDPSVQIINVRGFGYKLTW